jgi:signal transduction histidine kinase
VETSKFKSSRTLILFTAMAVLLPLLASLQYHWLGQVSEAASERLKSSLRASATAFRQEFNREFIRAYVNFHIDSFTPPAHIGHYHLERFEKWNQTAPYPRLISDVFLVTYDEQGRALLNHLESKSKQFQAIDWSSSNAKELLNLRDRFELTPQLRSNPRQTSLESFVEEVPALIIPFPPVLNQTSQAQGAPRPSGFTIINLDLNYIKSEFIPALMQRHGFDDSQTEYNVAIVSPNQPEKVIYSSGYPTAELAASDVSTPIFGLEADELRSFLSSQAALSTNAEQQSPRKLINLRLLKRSTAGGSSSDEDERWQLLIKHRAGSLAAAVSNARRRNLAISFGILLLLGAGIVMTAISSRRAERLARRQIDFVAGVTHELRTPLAVICSAGENLADGIVDTPQKARQYGDAIYREGRRLTDMVEQVLEFAGAQSGRQRYEFRPVLVADFIDAAIAACETQIQEKKFNVETRIAPDVPLVQGDSAALRRALQNLISNAIKYDGQSRWLRISAQASAAEQASEVRITVEDRGLGIDSTDIPHIFKPFFRGREAVAAQIEGSGVGLSVVKQVVEAHGGKISVTSTPGTGTTFTLDLPSGADAV